MCAPVARIFDFKNLIIRGKTICGKCWQFMVFAIRLLDATLREDFGFKAIMWVFSGRRGVHGWVGDRRARDLTPTARRAIVNYVDMVRAISKVPLAERDLRFQSTVHIRGSYPLMKRSLALLEMFEQDILSKQDILRSAKARKDFLRTYVPISVRDQITRLWRDIELHEDEKEDGIDKSREYWTLFEAFMEDYGLANSVLAI